MSEKRQRGIAPIAGVHVDNVESNACQRGKHPPRLPTVQHRSISGYVRPSFEELARRLSDAGCQIAGSAIFKIEKGNPRRRVTVDEMIAFAAVFGVPYEELLTPVEITYEDRARAIGDIIEELTQQANILRANIQELVDQLDDDPQLDEAVSAMHGDHWIQQLEVEAHPMRMYGID